MKKTLCLMLALILLLALPLSAAATEGEMTQTTSPDLLTVILVSFALGLILSLVIVLLMKRSMSTVRRAKRADSYVEKNSFSLTEARDIFLYSTVTRVRINNNKN